MKYIVRIKCVSQCMAIRRASLCYCTLENKEHSLLELGHPISKFNSIEINDGNIICNHHKEKLLIGEEVYFNLMNKVITLDSKEEKEILTLGAMIVPLDPEMEDYYINCINNHELFDQWNGEFEYLLGLMNELCISDMTEALKWYDRAIKKGFKYTLI
ncbi:MAG: hypothetical protein ACI35W_04340 [Anaeroplasmataceae bacterium]